MLKQTTGYKNSEDVILIADDDKEVRSTLSDILEYNKFNVMQAENGEDAIRIAKEAKPHLILLDILMPVLDGYETFRLLKEDKKTKDIPVLFVSALSGEKDQINGLKLGSLDYIVKPFNQETLIPKILTHVEHRKRQIEETCLEKALLRTNELERKGIEYEMHEYLCQNLVAIDMMMEKLDKSQIREIFNHTLDKAVVLANKAYPVSMRMGYGIVSALEELLSLKNENLGANCRLEYIDRSIPDHFTETALQIYRIAGRSIKNAIKFSKATDISISLAREEDMIILKIEYDGINLFEISDDMDVKSEVKTLSHLAKIFEASYEIESSASGKTAVKVSFPYMALL
ncbi:response regulator [bacterium]|nr:response regulator [bacterium]